MDHVIVPANQNPKIQTHSENRQTKIPDNFPSSPSFHTCHLTAVHAFCTVVELSVMCFETRGKTMLIGSDLWVDGIIGQHKLLG